MNQIFATAEEKMNKSLNNLSSEFASIRAGRANPAVLDKLSVDYYGSPTPINQVAAVSNFVFHPLDTLFEHFFNQHNCFFFVFRIFVDIHKH